MKSALVHPENHDGSGVSATLNELSTLLSTLQICATLVPYRKTAYYALALEQPDIVCNLCSDYAAGFGMPHRALGLLEMLGLTYTGCSMLPISLCNHPLRSRSLLVSSRLTISHAPVTGEYSEDVFLIGVTNPILVSDIQGPCVQELTTLARKAYQAFNCDGYARIRLSTKDNISSVLEVAPNPPLFELLDQLPDGIARANALRLILDTAIEKRELSQRIRRSRTSGA